MQSIKDIDNKVYEIKSRLFERNTNARKWALEHGFPYELTNMVIHGKSGIGNNPFTKSHVIKNALKAEGFWPEEEKTA